MADDVTLKVNERQISGWTSVRVTRGIERLPSDFDIGLTDLNPGDATLVTVQPGDACELRIGGDLVITGFVDRVEHGISAHHHSIRIMGRSKCEDLVDCAAEWPGGQISGASALEIARKLAHPYKITVTAGADVGPVIPQFNLMFGETAFEIIERVARWAALLAYDLPDGNLYMTRVGSVTAASGFVQGQNVQSASASYGMDQRYSEYRIMRQSMERLGDTGNGGNLLSTVPDKGVPRYRRHVIICETGGGAGEDIARKRGYWEAARRAGRSQQVHVVADSWRDAAGTLWTPNTLAPIAMPALKVPAANWLIGEITYRRSSQGTTAEIVLMPPDAFLPEPINLQPIWYDVPANVAAGAP